MKTKKKYNVSNINIILNLYGFPLVFYFVVRFLVGDKLSLIALLNNCIPVLLFPGLLALPISIKKRYISVLLWSVLTVTFLLFEFGHTFVPHDLRSSHHTPGASLRVLSHNTAQNLPDHKNIDQVIRESHADLVLLQEITKIHIDQYWPKMIDLYPYQVYGPLQGEKQVGMGILSRYPISNVEDFKLADDGLVFQQRARLKVDGKTVTVYNVHLTFPWFRLAKEPFFSYFSWPVYHDEVRRQEIESLVKLLEDEQHPVIAAGDFNLNDQSSDYQKLTNLLVDTYKNVGFGFGFTWPANRTPFMNIRPAIPFTRIDYIFHSPSIQSNLAKVLQETGSDHKPVIADLNLAGP